MSIFLLSFELKSLLRNQYMIKIMMVTLHLVRAFNTYL